MTDTSSSPDYVVHNSDLPSISTPVPIDYARLYLDPQTIPSPRIVGVLACQRDPYLRELRTRIVAVREAKPVKGNAQGRADGEGGGTAKATKGSKKDKKSGKKDDTSSDQKPEVKGAEPQGKTYEVELEDTVLFPEGGGQPNDTGLLIIGSSPNEQEFKVTNVYRKGLTAVHALSIPAELEKEVDTIIKVGQEVHVKVDWERRVDHMTLHTAQHLLSALSDNILQLPTLSWFLPPHPSLEPAYIELPRSLTPTEALSLESKANDLVTMSFGAKLPEEDVRVWIESKVQKYTGGKGSALVSGAVTPAPASNKDASGVKVDADTEEKQGLGLIEGVKEITRKEDEKEWGDRESRGLPKDYAGGVIRTAVIDGIDRSLCCGTHHPSLSQIKLMHVIPPSSLTTSSKPTRLLLLAGPRAIKHLIQASHALSLASAPLNCNRFEVAQRVEQRETARGHSERGTKALKGEVAKFVGTSVQWKESENGVKIGLVSRQEEATHEFDFMGQVNTAAQAGLREQPGISSEPRYVLVIHSYLLPNTTTGSSDANSSLVQISSNPPELAKEYGDKLKIGIDGIPEGVQGRVKGGGAKGRWMGKVSGKWGKAESKALADML